MLDPPATLVRRMIMTRAVDLRAYGSLLFGGVLGWFSFVFFLCGWVSWLVLLAFGEVDPCGFGVWRVGMLLCLLGVVGFWASNVRLWGVRYGGSRWPLRSRYALGW